MCGIAGVLYRDGARPPEAALANMALKLAHRGPDGQGVHTFDGGCGLAHRRLSIIDLSSAAAQPMSTATGSLSVAFNGEIYNFQELRAELEAAGHVFRTASDTEVILEAYLRWGEASFARLDGMFAIALWDARSKNLLLARDRTGKKPLFVYEDATKVVFGSEIKAILAHPDIDARENPEAVAQFLSHGYVPTPATFYAHIRSVKPAHFEVLTPEARQARHVEYWDFALGPERRLRTSDDVAEAIHTVRKLFIAAVKRRMVADVPLGAFLSGGIDSTLVVAVMSQLSSTPVKTFSIGFEGHPSWDETQYARLVADRFGTQHTEFKVRPDSLDLVEKLAWHFDQPFADPSALPTYVVSKLTREAGCTVALTGDGGDEVFAGYSRFRAAAAAERVPSAIRRVAHDVLSAVPSAGLHGSALERARRFGLTATHELPDRLRGWISIFPASELDRLLTPEAARYATPALLGESYTRCFKKAREAGADVLNQILYTNAKTYLLDDLNVKVDRAAMAASLECRSPFLDTALMDYVFSLPGHVKLRGRTTKWILKQAFAAELPAAIVQRKKMGFGVPLEAWLRHQKNEPATPPVLSNSALESARRRGLGGSFAFTDWAVRMLSLWATSSGR